MPTINLPKKNYNRVPTTKKREYQDIYQDRRWKGLRRLKLINSPLCERCERSGIVKSADEVHHVIPWDRGIDREEKEQLAYDYDNLMSVCFRCHDIIHEQLK